MSNNKAGRRETGKDTERVWKKEKEVSRLCKRQIKYLQCEKQKSELIYVYFWTFSSILV
jgi:hypothetical protein